MDKTTELRLPPCMATHDKGLYGHIDLHRKMDEIYNLYSLYRAPGWRSLSYDEIRDEIREWLLGYNSGLALRGELEDEVEWVWREFQGRYLREKAPKAPWHDAKVDRSAENAALVNSLHKQSNPITLLTPLRSPFHTLLSSTIMEERRKGFTQKQWEDFIGGVWKPIDTAKSNEARRCDMISTGAGCCQGTDRKPESEPFVVYEIRFRYMFPRFDENTRLEYPQKAIVVTRGTPKDAEEILKQRYPARDITIHSVEAIHLNVDTTVVEIAPPRPAPRVLWW